MLPALSGNLDIQERHIDSLQNKPTLSQNMQKGGYRLIELIASGSQPLSILERRVDEWIAKRAA